MMNDREAESQSERDYKTIESLRAELATEKKLHGIAKAFHDLAVADRALVDVKLAKAIVRAELAEKEIDEALSRADEMGWLHGASRR